MKHEDLKRFAEGNPPTHTIINDEYLIATVARELAWNSPYEGVEYSAQRNKVQRIIVAKLRDVLEREMAIVHEFGIEKYIGD